MFSSLEEYRARAHYCRCNGHHIAYWRFGEEHAPPLLLIHGFPSASWDWHQVGPLLQEGRQLIALDLLGFGLSDKPIGHRYSLLEQADIVSQLMHKLALTEADLLTHDYGDSVGQELLSRDVAQTLGWRINSLVFLNGGLFAETHRPLLTQKLLKSPFGPLLARLLGREKLARSFNKIFGPDTPPGSADIDVLWALLEYKQGTRVLPRLLTYISERKVHRNKWVQAMQSAKHKIAFINGRFDPISGEHMRTRYNELIPESKTASLDVGHYPQLEAPAETVRHYLSLRSQLSD